MWYVVEKLDVTLQYYCNEQAVKNYSKTSVSEGITPLNSKDKTGNANHDFTSLFNQGKNGKEERKSINDLTSK